MQIDCAGDNYNKKALKNTSIIDLSDYINDFNDTAHLIKQMDLMVSVDTSVAHLAGSIGHKSLIMLAYCADWRWFSNTEHSYWYQNMTLLRQTEPNNWQSVIDKVVEYIKQMNKIR